MKKILALGLLAVSMIASTASAYWGGYYGSYYPYSYGCSSCGNWWY